MKKRWSAEYLFSRCKVIDCDCGNRYIKTRKSQTMCVRCILLEYRGIGVRMSYRCV